MEELDSRVTRVTSGYGGITMPKYWMDGRHQRVYCVNCGAYGGWASTPEEGLEGIVYICLDCDSKLLGPVIYAPIAEPIK